MKLSANLTSILVIATTAHALPSRRADTIDDTAILNYALTLEHLENAFYIEGLQKYDEKAFEAAGFLPFVRGRFLQVAEHEKSHVEFLSKALGDQATKPCEYSFPHTDVKSFVALSQALEGVGVTAYTGAAQLISNKAYLTAAASVLATEARHASWIAAAVNKFSGWSGDFDVPLNPNQVYTLAGAFIKSCPSTNPSLPFKAFPTLSFVETNIRPGSVATVKFDAAAVPQDTKLSAVFFTGFSKIFAPVQDGKVTIPKELVGTVYAVIGKSDTKAEDDDIVAGPVRLSFEFDSSGKVIV